MANSSPMNTPLISAEYARLGDCLPRGTVLSQLDGYLAAIASGPTLVMPEQVLGWVWHAGEDHDQAMASMVVRHYLTVNDALNDQIYVPRVPSVQEWCRGYLASFACDMMAWAPLLASQPDWLKVIMSGAEDPPIHGSQEALTEVARNIHGFWVERRRLGMDSNFLLGQLAALSPGQAASATPIH